MVSSSVILLFFLSTGRSFKTKTGWIELKAGLYQKGAAYRVNLSLFSILAPEWRVHFVGISGYLVPIFADLLVNSSHPLYHH